MSNVIPLITPTAPATPTPLESAQALARGYYADRALGTGELAITHAAAIAAIARELKLDAATIDAAWLFAVPQFWEGKPGWEETLRPLVAADTLDLVRGLAQLHRLRDITQPAVVAKSSGGPAQAEVLRKMLLAMVEDIRVVLLRLASRTQTLRFLTTAPAHPQRTAIARETLDFYAPLANRLGVWQLKWELEDLAFRFVEPDTYKRIAKLLDEKRSERENTIRDVVQALETELAAAGLKADVAGRPKHIVSIVGKMRSKGIEFDQLYDVRAFRVLVDDVKDCYTALGLIHNLWEPVPREFDDYISRPKGNFYRSLHTVVIGPDDRALEVQIRTHEMHRHAELGVAAHWRYKEKSGDAKESFDEKIAWLRQLLAWRDEVAEGAGAGPANADAQDQQTAARLKEGTKRARLDDTIYVLTPQGRVMDLPRGSTPIDFAYTLHTDLGHRCRGAKVDGVMVPLNAPLANGQRVEIIAAKAATGARAGPSRDWLNPQLGYLASNRAKTKVRAWFNAIEHDETVASGRELVQKELQRLGKTSTNLADLAARLKFADMEEMFLVAGKGELGMKAVGDALAEPVINDPGADEEITFVAKQKPSGSKDGSSSGVLLVGVDKLLTKLASCCKPAPPDAIGGFITRGRGVSIHRADCKDFVNLRNSVPERVIESQWGDVRETLFAVDIDIEARDRQGLLRDLTEVLSREKLHVLAANSQVVRAAGGASEARLRFTLQISDAKTLGRALGVIGDVPGVFAVRRR